MKILVTGFDPFGKESINPAIEAVKRLDDEIANAQIIKLEIPTIAHTSLAVIKQAIEDHEPDMVLSIGQAGGRSDITVERIGINIDDYRIADNGHQQPIDEKIFADGPDAYFVNLPIKAMVKSIRSAGIPASISNSAGTFVCNYVTYGVRYLLEKRGKGQKSGFIHIPYLPSQVVDKPNQPSMALDVIVKGIQAAITAMVEQAIDVKESEGTIC